MHRTDPVTLLKALADPSRMRLVRALDTVPHCVEDLATRLDLAPSTVSHHLKILANAGLVHAEKIQYYTEYSLMKDGLDSTLHDLVHTAPGPDARGQRRLTRAQQQVVRACMRGSRLVQLPVPLQKRQLVLAALAGDLEPEREYSREAIMAAAAARYDDPARICQEWIEHGFVSEDEGIYRRVPQKAIPELALSRISSGDIPPTRAGICWIRNRETERVFLASSLDIVACLENLRARLDRGLHDCRALQDDWLRLGASAFELEIVESVSDRLRAADGNDALARLEQSWINGLQPFDEHCYNTSVSIRLLPA